MRSTFKVLFYVKNLTADRLQTFFDSNQWIITRRKKTNTESNIRLLDIPKRIMEKYKAKIYSLITNDLKTSEVLYFTSFCTKSKEHFLRLRS